MKRTLILVLLSLFVASPALAWDLYWDSVTQWTDNTAIESAHLPISYVVEWDGAVQPPTGALKWAIPSPSVGHGVAHVARVKAVTSTGIESGFSPPFLWNSAAGVLQGVRGIGVRQ